MHPVKRQLSIGHGQLYTHGDSIGCQALREDMFEFMNGQLMLQILRVFVRVADGHTSLFQCASCGEGANSLRTFASNVPRFGTHPHPRAMYITRLS